MSEEIDVAGLKGFIMGAVAIGAFSLAINYWGHSNTYSEATVFLNEEGKPKVMRLYREGTDSIMVEETYEDRLRINNHYVTLEEYLNKFQDKNERSLEKAKIEHLVRWED